MMGHCRKHCQRLDPDHWGRCVGRCGEQWAEICPRCAERERVAEQYRAEGRVEEAERLLSDVYDDLAGTRSDAVYFGRRRRGIARGDT